MNDTLSEKWTYLVDEYLDQVKVVSQKSLARRREERNRWSKEQELLVFESAEDAKNCLIDRAEMALLKAERAVVSARRRLNKCVKYTVKEPHE